MAQKQIGSAALNWGTKDEIWGYVESLSIKNGSEKEEVKNGIGDIVAAVYHGHKVTVSGSFTMKDKTGFTSDKIGTSLTFKTQGDEEITAYLDSSTIDYKRAGLTTISFEATFYPALEDSDSSSESASESSSSVA